MRLHVLLVNAMSIAIMCPCLLTPDHMEKVLKQIHKKLGDTKVEEIVMCSLFGYSNNMLVQKFVNEFDEPPRVKISVIYPGTTLLEQTHLMRKTSRSTMITFFIYRRLTNKVHTFITKLATEKNVFFIHALLKKRKRRTRRLVVDEIIGTLR